MLEFGIYEETGMPFSGQKRKKLECFLEQAGLHYDEQIEYTVNLVQESEGIIATGSIHRNVLKCIAVSEKYQGLGLSARIITNLLNYAAGNSRTHLFVFTKPQNQQMFSELGFYQIMKTDNVLLMENRKDGIQQYMQKLACFKSVGKTVGSVVVNCNPFTNGHRYLIEKAAADCDILHVFLVSEDSSMFPTEVRYRLLERGIADLKNVVLHQTSDYLISHAVFPTYFMKDKITASEVNCELDVRIFCEFFAAELEISRRYAGTEPLCAVTAAYNEVMRHILPQYGIQFVELPRKKCGEAVVSASYVRRCMVEEKYEEIQKLVPRETYEYIVSEEGRALRQKYV